LTNDNPFTAILFVEEHCNNFLIIVLRMVEHFNFFAVKWLKFCFKWAWSGFAERPKLFPRFTL